MLRPQATNRLRGLPRHLIRVSQTRVTTQKGLFVNIVRSSGTHGGVERTKREQCCIARTLPAWSKAVEEAMPD